MTNDFAGRQVVVTGGLGFIGSALARRLVDLDARVTIVDSLIPEYGGNRANIADIEDRVRVDVSDVRDRAGLRDVVTGCDFLFNLAGQTSHLDSMTDPFTDLDINCVAQLSILEACRAWNPDVKIVFASTRQLYGKPDYSPTDEAHLLRPVDVNGVNKMAGEWYHILYNNVYGLRATALRLTNTYGPGMRIKDARQTFLGIWVRRLLEDKPIEVWGGGQLRDFTYVDDAVEAFLLAAQDPAADGEVFNLGGEVVISLRDLAELLIDVAGGGEVVVRDFPEDRKRIDIGDYYADWSKIRRVLGWAPTVPIGDGLQRTIEYYRTRLAAYL
ncbi:MAG TPA: NAD-dependent epimerase/dehydratase family protein [Mycobacteriales bacterium]|nr:NAD-dependent epimerase/dehydratase family protein [Mycobacteriales bacterium]